MQIAFTLPMLNFRPKINQKRCHRAADQPFPRGPEVASRARQIGAISRACGPPQLGASFISNHGD
jgi:hypothetical protein